MASQNNTQASASLAIQSGRHSSPGPGGMRQRPLGRAATFAEPPRPLNRRRSSVFSEGFSEARRSFRSSTDDLLLPRAFSEAADAVESTHWHSLPLGLALLPAVAGLFFKDGSAIITDLTLLGLAAIFLNWALRVPWDWYHAAQTRVIEPLSPAVCTPIEEEENEFDVGVDDEKAQTSDASIRPKSTSPSKTTTSESARVEVQRELRIHELTALAACFVAPALGAWLLHAIRTQLSRPSEGLVSNYNLSIFLLVAEIRPLSHAMKMVQRRTLHLQRKATENMFQDPGAMNTPKLVDLTKRLDELETHVANSALESSSTSAAAHGSTEEIAAKASSQVSMELRKNMQSELDALNRAMRRYEKRMTISAIQTEARLQDLEVKLQDVVVIAAATQRNADKHRRGYLMILANWVSAAIVLPIQYTFSLLVLPGKLLNAVLVRLKQIAGFGSRYGAKESRSNVRPPPSSRQKVREKRTKPVT